ncbi:hypothetical protein Tco_0726213 [Tanacetum coccineum]|uniref:Homologous recombination OB-fold protein OB-fold domain-containing protein n=1 Tax=Tanacetum coccineum TaxID=301880 RepID=A0ABQ4YHH8_9ASTR
MHVHETTTTTQNPTIDNLEEKLVRIIPGPAGIVQVAKLRKQSDIHDGGDESVLGLCMSEWKLEQVVAIINSCTPNALDNLTMTLKDLSCTIHDTIHHKVINERGYGKDISVGSALILANVLVFSPKPSMHYLKITMRNVVKVFHKDIVPGNGSGVGGSGMLDEKEIMKL